MDTPGFLSKLGGGFMSQGTLDLVTRGWELPGWRGAFYPEGLPLEWRLIYFANEFPAVLVPADLWVDADDQVLGAWAGDVSDRFRFYLELPDSARSPGRIQTVRRQLGDKLAGLVGELEVPAAVTGGIPGFLLRDGPGGVAGIGSSFACRVPGSLRGREAVSGRVLLEAVAGRVGQGHALVVLDGDDVSIEELRRWWDLAYLLGFA